MSQVYSLLIQEERQRQVKNEPQFLGDNASFTAGTTKPATFQKKKTSLFCEHCKKIGHTMEKCYKLHGYPSKPQNRGRGGYQHASNRRAYNTWAEQAAHDTQSTQAEVQTPNLPGLNPDQTKQLYQYLANLTSNGATKSSDLEINAANMAGISSSITAASISNAKCLTSQLGNDIWILDSGASDHMSHDAKLLHDLKSLVHPITVSLPNGQQVQVSHCGILKLNNSIELENVLLVPQFKYNLLSVKQLAKQLHCNVIFSEETCSLQGLSLRRPVVVGKEVFGLYLLDKHLVKEVQLMADHAFCSVFCKSQSFTAACNQGSKHVSFGIWHQRIGHIPAQRLKLLPIDVIVPKESEVCDICHRAKQQRLPFQLSTISTSAPFELIHIDTWGPYHTKTYTGHRYFLTIVDDYTRTTWTHLMMSKDEAIIFIKAFVAMIDTQFHSKVQTIRSDNALEFTKSVTALNFFASNGILHQTSCIQTPQQNGVVERKHKHLLKVSRALLFQSKLPLRFWGDCVLTATHIINRLPTLLLQNKSPFEVLYKKVPSYDHLRVFGCLCYMSTTKQGRDKLQPRALPCVFLGYPFGKKAYKVMDLNSHKIHISRDVIFHETVFPYDKPNIDTPLFPSTLQMFFLKSPVHFSQQNLQNHPAWKIPSSLFLLHTSSPHHLLIVFPGHLESIDLLLILLTISSPLTGHLFVLALSQTCVCSLLVYPAPVCKSLARSSWHLPTSLSPNLMRKLPLLRVGSKPCKENFRLFMTLIPGPLSLYLQARSL